MAQINRLVTVSTLVILSNFALISAKLSMAETAAEQQELVVRYANSWAVEILGGTKEADALALNHGLFNRGQV